MGVQQRTNFMRKGEQAHHSGSYCKSLSKGTGGGSLEENDGHRERLKWMKSRHILETVCAFLRMQWKWDRRERQELRRKQGFGAATERRCPAESRLVEANSKALLVIFQLP